jgi:hypothetical protein
MVATQTVTEKSQQATTNLDNIKPAPPQLVGIYMPYFNDKQRKYLPVAMGLYKQGHLEGEREIIGAENIPFIATWSGNSSLPSDLNRCRIQFDNNPELSYEMMATASELVGFLWDVIVNYKKSKTIDFSQGFYYKLLQK